MYRANARNMGSGFSGGPYSDNSRRGLSSHPMGGSSSGSNDQQSIRTNVESVRQSPAMEAIGERRRAWTTLTAEALAIAKGVRIYSRVSIRRY